MSYYFLPKVEDAAVSCVSTVRTLAVGHGKAQVLSVMALFGMCLLSLFSPLIRIMWLNLSLFMLQLFYEAGI